ncbi:DUF2199 domain-containing protein [Hymenobacter actinosclerus]|nr:DUF2199 domain-containing protein [Hymenobacter actinosclerus]
MATDVPDGFVCSRCGEFHAELPMCFGAEFPDYYFSIPINERARRVEIAESLCVIDEEHFFVRGRIELPVLNSEEIFCWNVWTTLSKDNFIQTNTVWNDPERVNEPAYFGWLQTSLPGYPETLNLKTAVHTQAVGLIPRVEIMDENHPLVLEQKQGIGWPRVVELVEAALHS